MSDPNAAHKILVADDDAQLLGLVVRHLRGTGYKVIEAIDGDAAWEAVLDDKPDLVLLDVMMPGMSGWEVCRRIREYEPTSKMPVIMLTGIGERLNEMTSPLYGADDYLDKPFEFDVLEGKIRDILTQRAESPDA